MKLIDIHAQNICLFIDNCRTGFDTQDKDFKSRSKKRKREKGKRLFLNDVGLGFLACHPV